MGISDRKIRYAYFFTLLLGNGCNKYSDKMAHSLKSVVINDTMMPGEFESREG